MTAAIDIKKFCGHRGHSLQHLIRCTHGIVATDGSILICVPDDGREAAEDEQQITYAVNKWKMEIENANRKWHDMCNINLPAPLPCEFCSGNGYNFALACLDCEGDGAFEHGSESDVEMKAFLLEGAAGLTGLGEAFFGQIHVGPAGEAVLFVPGAFSVAEQYDFVHSFS